MRFFRLFDHRIQPWIPPKAIQGLHGCLEDIGPRGIRGWLLDCAARDSPAKVEVYAGGHLLGTFSATRYRPDISEIVGREIHCEFLIPWDTVTLPREFEASRPNTMVRIRLVAADSGKELRAIARDRASVGQLISYVRGAAHDTAADAPSAPARPYLRNPLGDDERKIDLIRTEFSESYYLTQNNDVAAAGVDPVRHYYKQGWKEGRNPNKLFDGGYYLAMNRDVRDAGINPFWHYLASGRREGRQPCPPGGYRRRILDAARPPEERTKYYTIASGMQLEDRDLLDRIDTALKDAAGVVVALSHDCYLHVIGGTQLSIADEYRDFAERNFTYIHLSPRQTRHTLAPLADAGEVQVVINGTFVGVAAFDSLVTALGAGVNGFAGTRLLIVHSLLGFHEQQVLGLCKTLEPERRVFWLHDFTALCEGFNLLRNDLAFCDAPPPDSMACRVCVFGAGRVHHLDRLQRLFEACGFDVLAPSQSALDLWSSRTGLPYASKAAHPHATLVPIAPDEPLGSDATPIRIGFVGYATPGKGWPVYAALVEEFHGDPRYSFMHFAAHSVGSVPGCQFVVTESTPGDRGATTRQLRKHRVDFLAILSPWPETFSHVAYEGLAAGCRLICLKDSGNVAALVRSTGLGVVVDDAEALRAFLSGGEAAAIAREARARPHHFQLVYSGGTATVKHILEEKSSP